MSANAMETRPTVARGRGTCANTELMKNMFHCAVNEHAWQKMT